MGTRWLWFIYLSCGIVLADPSPTPSSAPAMALPTEITTTDGHRYTKVKLLSVADDGITVMCDTGVSMIPFSILPVELQKQYNYDPAKAAKAEADRVKEAQDQQAADQAAQLQSVRIQEAKTDDPETDIFARVNWRFLSGQIIKLQQDGFILECDSPKPAPKPDLAATANPEFIPCAYGTFFIRSLGAQSAKPVSRGDKINVVGTPNGERNELMGPLPIFEAVPTHLLSQPQQQSIDR